VIARLLRFFSAFLKALFRKRERPLPRTPQVEKRRPSTKNAAQERAPRRLTNALEIEYSPRADGSPDPGEVVWAWVPYEDDPSQGKDRPVLLIGRRGEKLVGVALTSKPNPRHTIELGIGPWDREGRVSFVKVDRLIDLDPANVRREGAVLDRRRFERVIDAIRE